MAQPQNQLEQGESIGSGPRTDFEYEGITIKELAELTGKHPVEAFLDLALDEGLETEFLIPPRDTADDMRLLEQRLKDPYAHISVSDGGAHTRFAANAVWPVYWLAYWIRDREIMSLEQAHYKMSAYPAWFTDFKDRGTLRVANWLTSSSTIRRSLGSYMTGPSTPTTSPAGERRLIQKPTGLRYTIVNGTVTFEGNNCTGRLARQVAS